MSRSAADATSFHFVHERLKSLSVLRSGYITHGESVSARAAGFGHLGVERRGDIAITRQGTAREAVRDPVGMRTRWRRVIGHRFR
jgi:hypothetical protein